MVYACSDIHGNYEVYKKAVDHISDHDKLYIIGDVIDRGADGIKILLDLMQRENVELILGNHEWMMLTTVMSGYDSSFADIWTLECNQGRVTMESLKKLDYSARTALVDFLGRRRIAARIVENGKTYTLTHGYYDSRVEKILDTPFMDVITDIDGGRIGRGSANHDILWNSLLKGHPAYDYSPDGYYIHGHVPVIRVCDKVQPFVSGNVIFLDGGLQYGGGLILYNVTDGSFEVFR